MHQEVLPSGRLVFTDEDCTFGADALLLAEFAAVQPSWRVCDLGTGCGILPLLWEAPTQAVECSPQAAALARRSIEENGLSHRIQVVEERWEALTLPAGEYDCVVSNPPYFAAGSGALSRSPRRRLARHETENTLQAVVAAAARLLKAGGQFTCCHRPQRLADLLHTLRAHRLEPKRLQLVQGTAESSPFLVLCTAVKEAHPSLTVLPVRVLDKEEGKWQEH